jgi:hypothetical protein
MTNTTNTNYTAAAETAKANWIAARARYNAAKTVKARHEADMDIEFWSNKMAAVKVAERNGWAVAI